MGVSPQKEPMLNPYKNQIMKKFLVIAVAAIAAVALTASVSASDNDATEGTISFESASMPSLNCSISMKDAISLYRYVPGNIVGICGEHYTAVRNKCFQSSSFTHEGVKVRVRQSNGDRVTIELSVPGYKITANDVSWDDLELMFIGLNGEG